MTADDKVHDPSAPTRPSSLYGPRLWRMGIWLVGVLPSQICRKLSDLSTWLYWLLAPRRRETVIRNLLPAVGGNRAEGRRRAKELYRQFGYKLLDLWRYEGGQPIDNLLGDSTGWEHFVEAQAQKRGVLFVTPHLGNWEFGAPWLTRRGYSLQVITLAEPGKGFTQLRQASRARWKIETLVIGDDPFAIVDIIRRLENGAAVALLVDRPPETSAVAVELFGQPFSASIAAAELARASGCALLPVYLPREGSAYGAHILPPISYDRASLRDRTARQALTQQIIRAFEPIISKHISQWYHFVPVWGNSHKKA